MLPTEQELVEKVLQRIRVIYRLGPDSLDSLEMIMDLEAEFGVEPVKSAFRFLLAREAAQGARPGSAERDSMWDPDLDKGAPRGFAERDPMWDPDLDG